MSDDLIGGIRNALERGYPLDKIIASFISAGYSTQEVQEAASFFSSGVSNMANSSQSPSPTPQPQIKPSTPSSPVAIPKSSSAPIVTPLKQPILPPKSPTPQPQIKPSNSPISPSSTMAKPSSSQPFHQPMIPRSPFPQTSMQSPTPPVPSAPYYNPVKKESSKGTIIILVILLFVLIGLLSGLIFYKDKIATILAS